MVCAGYSERLRSHEKRARADEPGRQNGRRHCRARLHAAPRRAGKARRTIFSQLLRLSEQRLRRQADAILGCGSDRKHSRPEGVAAARTSPSSPQSGQPEVGPARSRASALGAVAASCPQALLPFGVQPMRSSRLVHSAKREREERWSWQKRDAHQSALRPRPVRPQHLSRPTTGTRRPTAD